MGWDSYANTAEGGMIIAQNPSAGYSDASQAFNKAIRNGHRKLTILGAAPWNEPVSGVVSDLDLCIPSSTTIQLNTTAVEGLGQFGLENITIRGAGKIVVPTFNAGQAVMAIVANRAHLLGNWLIDFAADGSGSPTNMKGIWLNGCTEAVVDGPTVRPRRNVDSLVVNGGSRLSVPKFRVTNGTPGPLEGYTPRKSGAPITITDCFAVDIGDVLLYGIGCTSGQLGEDLPIEWGLKVIANTAQEYGHLIVRAFKNYSFNCKKGIWLCGVPWFAISDDCYFCTQGILCNGADDAAIVLDSHDSTDGSTKKCGPGKIGDVQMHNIGLTNASGILVKRARDVAIKDPFIVDQRHRAGIYINTAQCRNIAIGEPFAMLAPDATAAALAPIVLASGAASGISIGRITYGRQVSDGGVGPASWGGTVPIHNIGGVTGTLRHRGLWDATNSKEPSTAATATNMDGITTHVPLS